MKVRILFKSFVFECTVEDSEELEKKVLEISGAKYLSWYYSIVGTIYGYYCHMKNEKIFTAIVEKITE